MRSPFTPTVIRIAAGLACAAAAGVLLWVGLFPAPRGGIFPRPLPAEAPAAVSDPVDGELVPPAIADRRPIAVVVDNHPEARPQSGLASASRVYEALTEGGITRYLAVFGPHDAARVGPVRSIRTQFLDYVLELHAAVAHVGGNADALALLPELHIASFDQLRWSGAYSRIARPGTAFEHTVFTSTPALRDLVIPTDGHEPPPDDAPVWKDDAPRDRWPAAGRVTIDFSTPLYRVSWVYRADSNDYARMLAGAPDADAATGEAVAAKVVAIAVIPRTLGRTRIGEETWTFADLGSGLAWVLQDGTAVAGTWRKISRADRLRFFDGSGREIALDRGPEWVEIIPPDVSPVFE